MFTRHAKPSWQGVFLVIGLASFNAVAEAADTPANFQVVDGVAIYLGVIPAQMVQGHPRAHPEAQVHGGVPARADGNHVDHMVVALFDNATGQRIENAQVSGSVMEIGLGAQQKTLEPMRIADSVTYGNYFDMPSKDIYHFRVRIRRPDVPGLLEAQFTHQHFGD